MNAGALLQSQGWRGQGHTLHATDDSTGLAKPLLVSRKDNKLGIGSREHGASNDQWWLNAFDQQLKGLDTSRQGVVVQTVTQGQLNAAVASRGGKYKGAASLYASFVRGGMLEGTIRDEDSTDATTPEADEIPRKETKEERRARRDAKKLRKEEKAARKAAEAAALANGARETTEERRARKEAKRRKREERRQNADSG